MRKVVGASRKSLIAQFIGESLLYALLSTILAIALIYLAIKPFNTLIGEDLSVDLLKPLHLGFLLTIMFICGILAGSYPALYLSAFNPLTTIKGGKQKRDPLGSFVAALSSYNIQHPLFSLFAPSLSINRFNMPKIET